MTVLPIALRLPFMVRK